MIITKGKTEVRFFAYSVNKSYFKVDITHKQYRIVGKLHVDEKYNRGKLEIEKCNRRPLKHERKLIQRNVIEALKGLSTLYKFRGVK